MYLETAENFRVAAIDFKRDLTDRIFVGILNGNVVRSVLSASNQPPDLDRVVLYLRG